MDSSAYVYSDGNYSGIYCEGCADEQWRDDARRIVEDNADPSTIVREIRELELPWLLPAGDCSDRGETCEICDEQVCPPWFTCDGCDHTGWPTDFQGPIDAEEVDWNGDDGPHTAWCDECEDQNHGDVLLADDGRGYVLRFLADFHGEMTYRQPDGGYSPDSTGVYSAGCRRFTLADALRHWGPGHPFWRSTSWVPLEDSPAYRLSSAVLRHAMRRALPRVVIPSERVTSAPAAAPAAA